MTINKNVYNFNSTSVAKEIINFIKLPVNGDLILSNPDNGIRIRILKDWDFLDVLVSTKDESYGSSFSVDIEDFADVFDFIYDSIDKCENKLSDAEKEILDYVENGENNSEIELKQPALNVKIRVFKHYDGVCGIIVDSMIPAVDTFKLNDVDIDDVRYFVTDHNGIVDFDWLNNAIEIAVEANKSYLAA